MIRRYLNIFISLLLLSLPFYYPSPAEGKWAQNGAPVPAGTAASRMYPSITATGDGSGSAFIAWEDLSVTPGDIYFQKIDINGTPLFDSDKDATIDNSASKQYPAIAGDGSGGAFVVWEDSRNGNTDIYIQKMDGSGNLAWSEDKAVCSASGTQWNPRLVLTSDGDVIVAWEDRRSSVSQIYAQRIDKTTGSPVWTTPNGIAVSAASGNQFSPAISSDGYDGAVVVWEDQRDLPTTGSDIYAQRINSSGTGQWASDKIAATNAAGDQWFPAIATDGQNSFIITWEDYRIDGIFSDIYAKGVDYGGYTLFGDKEICYIYDITTGRKDVRHPAVAYSTNEDSFIIAWEDYRSDPNYTSDIYAQRINYAGTLAWASNGIAISTENDYQEAISITSSDSLGVITAWQDFRSGTDYGIYSLPLPVPGSITIDADAASTTEATVDLALSATGLVNTITQMRLRNDNPDWANDSDGWETYSTTKTGWSITDSEGARKVYVQFKDGDGNISSAYFDGIALSYIPTGSVTITEVYNSGTARYTNSTSVNLTISATNAEKMCISNTDPTTTACSAWEDFATTKVWTLTSGDGQKTVYIQFHDQYGNISSTYYSDTIILDTTGPSGTSLTITSPITTKDGITYTNSATVTLSVLADDGSGSGVSNMNFSNNNTTSWGNESVYANTIEWNLNFKSSGDGLKKVYAQFRDNLVNYGGATVSNSVILDTTAPAGSISITGSGGMADYTNSNSVNLTLSATDSGSGMDKMRFSNDNSTWNDWEAYNTNKSWTLSTGDGAKTAYVQFKDVVENIAVYSANITLDTAGPTGSVIINSGDAYTTGTALTLTISATDAYSEVSEMRFSNDNASWSTWEIYGTAKSWPIPAGDGTKTVYAQFKDSLGNVSSSFNSIIKLDTTSPTGSVLINNGAAYANTDSVTLNLSANDNLSGTAYMRFSNDNSTWTSWEAYAATENWMLPSGDGQKTVYAQFKDTAGNTSTTISDDISLETSQPSSAISSPSNNASINGTSHTITGTASDTGSGISKVEVSTDGGSTWSNATGTTSWTYSWTLPADGSYTVNTRATDAAGNIETVGAGITVTVDNTAPLTTATPEGGNYNSSQSVALSASETATIYYTTDGSAPTTSSSQYTSEISITGTTTLKYFAVDAAGNTETVNTQVYNIDTVVPSTTASPAGGLYNSAQSVTLTSSKPTESTIYYTTDGSAPTTSSNAYASPIAISSTTTLKFFARDIYGNSESVKTEVYTIDGTAPTGSITVNSGDAYTASASVTLTLSAADANGVSQMQFSSNNTDWSSAEAYTTSKAWTLATGDGTKTIYVKFRDNAGNWSSSYSDTITLDTDAPVTTATPEGGNYNSSQSVTLSASETATIYYTTDGAAPTTSSSQYASAISITGTTTLKYFAVDAAGNTETVNTQVYNIDTVVPSTTASPAGGLYNTAQSVALTSSKPTESTIYYTTDGSAPATSSTAYASAIAISSTTTLKFFARDIYGNQESVNTQVYTIDTAKPLSAITSPSNNASINGTSHTITGAASDTGSGVSKVEVSTDGGSTWSNATGTTSWTYSWTLPADDSYTVNTRATDVAGNIQSPEASITVTVDNTAPVGTIAINDGAAYTTMHNVTLTLSGDADISQMQFSNDNATWSTQEAYSISKSWTLSSGDETKTVYARFMDNTGNWNTIEIKDTIILDTTGSTGSITIDSGAIYAASSNVILTVSASDPNGVDQMQFSDDNSSWSEWESYSSTKEWTLTAGDGLKTVYARFKDMPGNISQSYSDDIVMDTTLPTGSITINSDAAYANTTSTTLAISCTDSGSGCSQMQFSNDNLTWSTPEDYAVAKTWDLSSTEGTKAVYAKFKDNAGNWNTSEIKDTISLDTTPPSVGSTVPANGSTGISADSSISVIFSENVANAASSILLKQGEAIIDSTVTYDDSAKTATITPSASLDEYSAYTVVITTGIRDAAATPMAASYSFSFTTADITNPSSVISAPSDGAIIGNTGSYNITGTASDTGSGISKVEISTDGGSTWNNATGTTSWAYSWTLPADGSYTINTRATDVEGNPEAAGTGIAVTVDNTPPTGAVSINDGATYTNSTNVTLALSASDANGIAQMQFSNDNSSWSAPEAYATTKTWALVAGDGLKTVYAGFKDNAGNWSTAEIKTTITLDTTILTGSIKINSDGEYTNTAEVTLTISGTNDVSEMQFSNDNLTWSTPEAYAATRILTLDAGDGLKTVYARFRDNAGNVSSSFSDSITLDTTAPASSITSPSSGAKMNGDSYTITGTALDSASGVSKVEVSTDGGTNWSEADGTASWTYAWTITDDGTYTIKARATDAAGNAEVAGTGITFTFDNVAPTGSVAINDGAAYTNTLDVTLTISASDTGSGTAKMQYGEALKGNWQTYAASATYRLNSGEGTKTVYIQFMDAAGNTSEAYSDTITLDTSAPGVNIVSPVSGITNNATPTLTYTVSDGTVVVFVDDMEVSITSGNNLDPLSDGSRTIRVEATDLAGNTGSSEVTITVDTAAPETSIASQPANPSNSTSADFLFSSTEAGSAFECQMDDGGYSSCTSPKSYSELVVGSHTFEVRATDQAGNTDNTPASYSWAVDTTAPALTINSVTTPTNINSQTITGTVEGGASVYVTMDTAASDGAAIVTEESWSYTITELVEGINNIMVTASNTAGNSSTATTGITLDTTPPEPQETSPAITLEGGVTVPGQTDPSYSYSNFTASWPSYSDSADTVEYEIALGDAAGGTNVKNWTSVGTETSVSTGDLQSLFETYKNSNGEYFGKAFYLNVKAIDASGNESAVLSVSFVYTPAEISSKAGDRDGTVDGFDLGMLGIAYDPFGSVPSGYEAADINMDGKVDNDDLFILAVNFGKVRQ